MKLQTHIPLAKQPTNLIDYHSKILLLGSCFVENMGEKLSYFKFQHLQNPFGIIFNPVSLARIIERSLKQQYYKENDIFFINIFCNCFSFISDLWIQVRKFFLKL